VSGLYQRALSLSRQVRRQQPVPAPVSSQADSDGITSEERAKIATRIDSIMAENRISISPQTLAYKPKRSGAVLPIVSNVSILGAVVIAGLIISSSLNRQEQDIATGRTAVQGAENRLIEALKQDSERRLRERDQTILASQQKLQELSSQQEQLRGQTDAVIKARSDELQSQFDKRLQAERDRLQADGQTTAAESARLRQFETAQRQALEKKLLDVRRQAEADLATREKSITGLAAQYQKDLEAARQERLQMQNDLAQREAELRSQYAAGQAKAQGEAARVSEELARMQADRQKEQLVLDQIYGGYNGVNRALQAGDYAGALTSLDTVRTYFDNPDVASLPTIQKRRPVELFLVGSLEELIKNRKASASADAASLLQSSTDLRAVSDLVSQGDALSQAGNLAAARQAYLLAIQKIPYVGHSYARLEELKPPAEPAPALIAGMRQANVFYQAGNFLGSVEQYRAAVNLVVKDDALAKQFTDNVMNAGYHLLAADDLAALSRLRTDEQKRQAIIARLRDIRTQYVAYTQLAPKFSLSAPSTDASLASLLQAKILIRQVVDSEPVRSKYPDLGASVDQYFAALEEQGRAQGRKSAIADMSAILDRLGSGGAQGSAVSGLHLSSEGGPDDPLVALLDRLNAVLSSK